MKTNVYVDGFNLYYGCLKGTPHRRLDLTELCAHLLPGHDVTAIKYFTALVKPHPGETDQPIRQQTYLRALRTFPQISVTFGHYVSHAVMMTPPSSGTVWQRESCASPVPGGISTSR